MTQPHTVSDGDGVDDACRIVGDHVHPHTAGTSTYIPHEWLADPTCRNQYRWWDGQKWTENVANNGVATTDPLREGENPSPPVEGETPDCTTVVEDTGLAYPLTAVQLGCNAGDTPVCTMVDGLPRALRLMAYDEIAATGNYRDSQLSEVRPQSVPESEALDYINRMPSRMADLHICSISFIFPEWNAGVCL